MVKGVAITVSDVTKRTESEERLRSQSRELALLHRVRSAVARELEVPGVLARAVEAVAETYGHTRLGAYLLEGGELVLQHQVGYQEAPGRIPLTKGVCGRAVTRRASLARGRRERRARLSGVHGGCDLPDLRPALR